jgi:hypothetical protein
MSKTQTQRRLDLIHRTVGREIVEQYFPDATVLSPLLAYPESLRRTLDETLARHPRARETRERSHPMTTSCLDLLGIAVRMSGLTGVSLEFAQETIARELGHVITLGTIREMIRRNYSVHDLVVRFGRVRLRGEVLAQAINERHQSKLRFESLARAREAS